MTGNKLKIEIKKLGLTQEEAAKLIGITRQTLGIWLKSAQLSEGIEELVMSKLGINANNVSFQSIGNGHNINGNGNKLNSETDRLIDLLKKKDEQIDRLLTLLENNQKHK